MFLSQKRISVTIMHGPPVHFFLAQQECIQQHRENDRLCVTFFAERPEV